MTEDEAVASAAWAFVRGSNVYAAMTPGHSGKFDHEGDGKLLGAVGDWLGKQKRWIEGATAYADVGVVRGGNAPDLRNVPAVGELWPLTYQRPAQHARPGDDLDAAIRETGYFSELLGTAFARRAVDWQAYRLLVLPENAVLDEATVTAVREYVRGGGKLLAFGNASRLDPAGRRRANFGLNDTFGVDLVGELPGYKRLRLKPDSGLAAQIRVNPGALQVRPTTARVLATWESAGDAPAIVENRFGNGTAIYVTADEASCAQSRALLEELAGRLIGAPVIKVRGARQYAMLMNRRDDGLILYLFNRSTGSRAYVESGMVPGKTTGLAPEPVEIGIDTGVLGDIGRVELLPDGHAVRISARRGESRAWFDAAGSVTALRLARH
jgi:hypothetical protein